jgi:hypothetical protein
MWGRAMFLRDVNRTPIAEAGNRFATKAADRRMSPAHERRIPRDDLRGEPVAVVVGEPRIVFAQQYELRLPGYRLLCRHAKPAMTKPIRCLDAPRRGWRGPSASLGILSKCGAANWSASARIRTAILPIRLISLASATKVTEIGAKPR